MTTKSDLWDIRVKADVTFKRVSFKEEVTEKEAIRRFYHGEFENYMEAETAPENTNQIISAESY
jgi:hypothetical protein